MVELEILGEPMGKQRPRYSSYGGFVRTYTPQKTINYESLITYEYNKKYGKLMFDKDKNIKLEVIAYYKLSKSDYGKKGLNKSGKNKIENKYCTTKNDIDNVIKIIMDALNSICYYDDKQIVAVEGVKLWTEQEPRVSIKIKEL